MRWISVGFAVCVLAGCSSGDSTSPSSDAGTASTSKSDDTAEVTMYKSSRDEICEDASADIATINADWIDAEGATAAEQATGLGQVIERTVQAQEQLDELQVPPSLDSFVSEDAARRVARLSLEQQLVSALRSGDLDNLSSPSTLDQELTDVNIETESAEDEEGLIHCA